MPEGKACPACGTWISRREPSTLTPTERAVLHSYRALSGSDRTTPVRVGCTELGRLIGRSPGSVQRARATLVNAGFLIKVDSGGGDTSAGFLVVD